MARSTPHRFRANGVLAIFLTANVADLQHPGLKAEIALTRDDGETCGRLSREFGWGDAVLKALAVLAEKIEEDTIDQFFEVPSITTPASDVNEEPTQF